MATTREARIYDRERDDLAPLEHVIDLNEQLANGMSHHIDLDEQLANGMSHHAVRLAVALETVLADPDGHDALTFARATLDEYTTWFTGFQHDIDERWTARFGEAKR